MLESSGELHCRQSSVHIFEGHAAGNPAKQQSTKTLSLARRGCSKCTIGWQAQLTEPVWSKPSISTAKPQAFILHAAIIKLEKGSISLFQCLLLTSRWAPMSVWVSPNTTSIEVEKFITTGIRDRPETERDLFRVGQGTPYSLPVAAFLVSHQRCPKCSPRSRDPQWG